MTAPVQVGPSPSGGGLVAYPDQEELLADIGDRIRAERQARGWIQAQLAERSGLSRWQVKQVEAGADSLRAYAAVCRALEMPLDYLLSDRWRMPERGPSLTGRQVVVLRAVAGGDPLSAVAVRIGMPRDGLAARLSEIYRRLGVSQVPKTERRAAAVRVASEHGLLNTA